MMDEVKVLGELPSSSPPPLTHAVTFQWGSQTWTLPMIELSNILVETIKQRWLDEWNSFVDTIPLQCTTRPVPPRSTDSLSAIYSQSVSLMDHRLRLTTTMELAGLDADDEQAALTKLTALCCQFPSSSLERTVRPEPDVVRALQSLLNEFTWLNLSQATDPATKNKLPRLLNTAHRLNMTPVCTCLGRMLFMSMNDIGQLAHLMNPVTKYDPGSVNDRLLQMATQPASSQPGRGTRHWEDVVLRHVTARPQDLSGLNHPG
jgi:hypothetical protein